MECKYCKASCQKAGKQAGGKQKYFCKPCKKYQQNIYSYNACNIALAALIPKLVCDSVSIRDMARILNMSSTSIVNKIKKIAAAIPKPPIPIGRPAFELDELRTYIGHKQNQYWVAYAICSQSREVVDFVVGKRSKRTLTMIVNNLLCSRVGVIKTDRLNIYASLIPRERHDTTAYNTNHIERKNLNLRTHLKRLGRRTICFSKSMGMLYACVKIYFWFGKMVGCIGCAMEDV